MTIAEAACAAARSSAWAARRCAARSQLEEGGRYELTVDYPAEPRRRAGARPRRRRPRRSRPAITSRGPSPMATGADVAIVIVGTDDEWETEGEDRSGLALPLDQDELVAAVVAANPNTIVVLNTGSPVTMPWLDDVAGRAAAVVPRPGDRRRARRRAHRRRRAGRAAADHVPARARGHAGVRHHPGPATARPVLREGLFIGHRWYDRERHRAAVPVRSGLGYTTFELRHGGGRRWGRARRHRRGRRCATPAARDGSEVVQIYVEPPAGDPARPLRHLAGFARVDVGRRRGGHGHGRRSIAGRSPRGSTGRGSSRPASTSSTSAATAATSAGPASSPPDWSRARPDVR